MPFDEPRVDAGEVLDEIARLRVGICPGLNEFQPVKINQVVGSIVGSMTSVRAVASRQKRQRPNGSAEPTLRQNCNS